MSTLAEVRSINGRIRGDERVGLYTYLRVHITGTPSGYGTGVRIDRVRYHGGTYQAHALCGDWISFVLGRDIIG